ncbi:hypothetical protein CK203_021834 [Vitis vinifera]|uniref:Uncharacterized protein n=1 Tax=Vitis vinifera TaxID=29760 RepID=A0A438JFY3_VITVI|nr:hypothetical protein CK203_021834 [Vitis vinifera]
MTTEEHKLDSGSWVSDLSTTDLMTDSSHCFSMLSPCLNWK